MSRFLVGGAIFESSLINESVKNVLPSECTVY